AIEHRVQGTGVAGELDESVQRGVKIVERRELDDREVHRRGEPLQDRVAPGADGGADRELGRGCLQLLLDRRYPLLQASFVRPEVKHPDSLPGEDPGRKTGISS